MDTNTIPVEPAAIYSLVHRSRPNAVQQFNRKAFDLLKRFLGYKVSIINVEPFVWPLFLFPVYGQIALLFWLVSHPVRKIQAISEYGSPLLTKVFNNIGARSKAFLLGVDDGG